MLRNHKKLGVSVAVSISVPCIEASGCYVRGSYVYPRLRRFDRNGMEFVLCALLGAALLPWAVSCCTVAGSF